MLNIHRYHPQISKLNINDLQQAELGFETIALVNVRYNLLEPETQS